jgi:hypothetical protein
VVGGSGPLTPLTPQDLGTTINGLVKLEVPFDPGADFVAAFARRVLVLMDGFNSQGEEGGG